MLSGMFLIVAGLSTSHKIGLAAVGAAFIAFALISSFVLPRRNPNFPGQRMGLYVTVCVLFFAAMVSAVIILGKESKEAHAEQVNTPSTSTTATAPTTTASASTTPSATQGDPAAGKTVFASSGCTGCHTLKAAGATGTVGPNLDQLKPAYARIVTQVENGGGAMPAFKGQLSQKQIQDVAAYVFASTHP
jgi:mono/diheme cytochrome c family protein